MFPFYIEKILRKNLQYLKEILGSGGEKRDWQMALAAPFKDLVLRRPPQRANAYTREREYTLCCNHVSLLAAITRQLAAASAVHMYILDLYYSCDIHSVFTCFLMIKLMKANKFTDVDISKSVSLRPSIIDYTCLFNDGNICLTAVYVK